MQFVKIGSTGINLDLVLRWGVEQREETVLRDDGTRVRTGNVYNAVQLTYVNGEYEWFEGDDAAALRACLEGASPIPCVLSSATCQAACPRPNKLQGGLRITRPGSRPVQALNQPPVLS